MRRDEKVRRAQRVAYETNDPQAWAELYVELQRAGFSEGIEGKAGLFEEWIPVLAVLGDPGARLIADLYQGAVMFDDPDHPGQRVSVDPYTFFSASRAERRYGYALEFGKTFIALVSCAWVKAATPPGRRKGDDRFSSLVRFAAEGVPIHPTHLASVRTWRREDYTDRMWAVAGAVYELSDGDFREYDPRPGYSLGVAFAQMAGWGERDEVKPGQVALTLVKPWILAGSPRHWDPTPYLDREDFWNVRLP